MRRVFGAVISGAWLLLVGHAAAADWPAVPVEAMIPVVAVHLGRPVSEKEMDDVVSGLGAPVLRGKTLRAQLGLRRRPDDSLIAEVTRTFENGEDLFFTGRHEEAARAFETAVQQIEKNPVMLAFQPALRETAFKAHVHLAIISRGNGDGQSEEKHLRAAEAYPELSPAPADFPPWICERFELLKETPSAAWEGTVTLTLPQVCELIILGRSLGHGTIFKNIAPGIKIAQVRCGEDVTPAQEIIVKKGGVRFRPLLFTSSRLSESDEEVTLIAKDHAEDRDIVQDLLLLGEQTGHHRLVAVVGTDNGLEVWLVDDRQKRVIRESRALPGHSEGAKQAGEAIVPTPEERDFVDASLAPHPWYRNLAAWMLAGSGVALLGTGLALYGVYGSPSELIPVALALAVSGAGMAGTGVVLFFFPAKSSRSANASVAGITYGISLSRSF